MILPFPALRADLEVMTQTRGGKPAGYVIKDPSTHLVFDVEEEDYFICQQLDGHTPPQVIQTRYQERFGSALPLEDLEAFIRQLQSENLLSGKKPGERISELAGIFDIEQWRPTVRLELCNPDRFFSRLYSLAYWLFLPISQICLGLLVVSAVYVLLLHGGKLWDEIELKWSHGSFWSLVQFYVTWVFVTEGSRCLGRGLIMQHYGLRINKLTIIWVYRVIPIIWVTSTERWMLRDKGKRIRIPCAGLFAQLLVLSFGVVAWKLTTAGTTANFLWLAVVEASALPMILHNANPLVMMDGYTALVLWLGIPKLRERAFRTAVAWLNRRVLPEPLTKQERRGFLIYGLLALIWSVGFITYVLIKFGSSLTVLFQSGGVLLFFLLVLYLMPRPLTRPLLKPLRWLSASQAGAVTRRLIRLGWLVALILAMFIPYPYQTGGTVAILPNVRTEVHCEIDGGRIDRVFVREGDDVQPGQPLARIDPSEYETNFQATRAQLDNTEAKLRQLRRQLAILDKPPDIEEIHGLEAEVRRLKTLVSDYKRQLDLTTLRAPGRGRITTPQIDQKAGQYLKKGELLATIEQAEAVQVEIQVPEQDAPLVMPGAKVKVALWSYPNDAFYGTVRDIAPIAATPAGSVERSVRVIAELPNKELLLKSQLTGYAKIRTRSMPVWLVLWRPLIRWFNVQFWYWLP